MSVDAQTDQLAVKIAEDVLRTIYGDDFKGCTISLESIAAVIREPIAERNSENKELLDLYSRLVEAIHLLSTPPESSKVAGPDELRSLLGDRMDAIHSLTAKTIDTTSRLKTNPPGSQEFGEAGA